MAEEFNLRICTPKCDVVNAKISELVVSAFDGEMGVLPNHKDFITLLGTGLLKLVRDNNDYWYMLSSGVLEIKNGDVTVLTEIAESDTEVDVEKAEKEQKELEPLLKDKNTYSKDYIDLKSKYDSASARVEVYRRTHLVN